MQLPYFQSDNIILNMLQTKWKSLIDPLLAKPIVNGNQLLAIDLSIGANSIPHRLQRMQQGWILTDVTGAATIYRSEGFNAQFLVLTSDAAVTCSIWVY